VLMAFIKCVLISKIFNVLFLKRKIISGPVLEDAVRISIMELMQLNLLAPELYI